MNNNLKLEPQKISNGCLIVAFHSPYHDYVASAIKAADRVNKFLQIPVSIITDKEFKTNHNLIIVEKPKVNIRPHPLKKEVIEWYNLIRTRLYDLSPYERTLVIDSDFLLNTDNLLSHLNSSADFVIAHDVYDLINKKIIQHKVGSTSIPLYWATVMIFNKSTEAHNIFELAKIIEKNYDYYSILYGFTPKPIRNDIIFSIALHLIGGYGLKSYSFRNYPLVNCNSSIKYIDVGENYLIYEYFHIGKTYKNKISDIDLHLMNKDEL